MADPKIKYDIEAAVKGEADAEQLAKALRDVGDVLEGDLQKGARDAADALQALGDKQAAVTNFQNLKNETGALAIELAQAQTEFGRVDAELTQASAAAQKFAAAELEAKATLEASKSSLAAAKKAYEDLQASAVGAARKTDEFKLANQGAKDNIQQLSAEIKQQSRSLKESEASAREAQQAENTLSAQHQKTSASLILVRAALQDNNAALEAGRSKLGAMGLEAGNLSQAERNLQAAVAQVREQVAAMAPAYQQAAAASSQSTQVQAQNQRTLRDGMTSISTQLQRIQQIATVALGGSYVGGLAKSVADTADEFKNLQARIKLVTGEGPLFQEAFQGVTDIALRTNSALDDTGTLFARLAKAGQDAGKSAQSAQRDALQLTETINQSVQLSGGAAESSKAAIIQLIQGLQSGVLRGEEFNSVMEQAPRLAQAMANGLGVTTGELRKLSAQGALTAETVMGALRGQADVVAAEFAKLPPTVGRALQNLSSQWTLYVGSADNGMVSSANAAKVIDALAKNLDTLVITLEKAGKLWAAIKIAGLASDFGAWATKTIAATLAVESNTVAVGANTVVQRANATAVTAAAAAQAANTAATVASTAAKTSNAAAWGSIGTFAGQAAAATRGATAATVASTAATAAGTASTLSRVAAISRLGGIIELVATGAKFAVRGVVSVLGGPVGAIVTVALFSSEIKKGIGAVTDWAFSFTEAGKKIKAYDQTQINAAGTARANIELIKGQQAALERQTEAQEKARLKSFELTKQAQGLSAQFDKLRKDGDSAAEAIGKIGKDFDLSSIPGIKDAAAVLDKLLAEGKLTAAEFQAAWADALSGQDLGKFEAQARAAFSGAAREGERLAQMLDATLRESVKRTGLDWDTLQGKISAASRSALNDVDSIVRGMARLKEQGVDTGLALTASLSKAINTADSQKTIDELKSRIESLRGELGKTVTDGLLEQAAQKALELKDALDKVTPGINSAREAMKELGITSDADLKRVGDSAKQAYDVLRTSGTASAREVGEAFKIAAEKAIAANNGIAPTWVEAEAAVRGYKIEVDAAGKTTVVSMKDAAAAVKKVGDTANDVAGALRRMGIDAATASEEVKRLAAAGQMLAAAEQARQDANNKNIADNQFMKRPGMNPIDAVPQFNTQEEAAAWLENFKKQYRKDNPFDVKQKGALGRYGYDLTMFEYQAELKALSYREAMKNANGGKNVTDTSRTPAQGNITKTVNINVSGVRTTINTDDAGEDAINNLIRQLGAARGTSSVR